MTDENDTTQADQEIREMLDGVTVRQHGEELTDYSSVLCAVVQELQGSLPDDGYTFEWSPVTRARAARIVLEQRERVEELFERACREGEEFAL